MDEEGARVGALAGGEGGGLLGGGEALGGGGVVDGVYFDEIGSIGGVAIVARDLHEEALVGVATNKAGGSVGGLTSASYHGWGHLRWGIGLFLLSVSGMLTMAIQEILALTVSVLRGKAFLSLGTRTPSASRSTSS